MSQMWDGCGSAPAYAHLRNGIETYLCRRERVHLICAINKLTAEPCRGARARPGRSLDRPRRTPDKVQNQGDDRHDQQDVNEPACDVKNAPTQNPGQEQDDEQNREDTHMV